uniref:rRNA-processing protein EBP2-like protein n=1 Tax=Dracunculus medinensis TaxID=318479 RepID=A0A158Q5G3_DRAME
LKLKIGEFQKRMPWIETLDITVENEMNTIYKQAKKAAEIAIQRLKQMKMKVFRPSDYFAEMVKSDTHMQKVRQRIADIREGKERQENIRRLREEKKFAAKVQREVIENRQNEKKKLKEAVMKHRKGLKGQLEEMLNNAKSLQIYDDKTDATSHLKKKDNQMRNGVKCSKLSRNARNKKFGFGGQKKRSKNNTKER